MGKTSSPSTGRAACGPDLELSEPRWEEGEWIVDVTRVSDGKKMGDVVLTPELLPPRTNKQGKVLWQLPAEGKPRLGLSEQRVVFDEYRKKKKQKKDANRAVAKIQKKQDAARKGQHTFAARRIQQWYLKGRPGVLEEVPTLGVQVGVADARENDDVVEDQDQDDLDDVVKSLDDESDDDQEEDATEQTSTLFEKTSGDEASTTTTAALPSFGTPLPLPSLSIGGEQPEQPEEPVPSSHVEEETVLPVPARRRSPASAPPPGLTTSSNETQTQTPTQTTETQTPLHELAVTLAAIGREHGGSTDDRRRWVSSWKIAVVERLDEIADIAYRAASSASGDSLRPRAYDSFLPPPGDVVSRAPGRDLNRQPFVPASPPAVAPPAPRPPGLGLGFASPRLDHDPPPGMAMPPPGMMAGVLPPGLVEPQSPFQGSGNSLFGLGLGSPFRGYTPLGKTVILNE